MTFLPVFTRYLKQAIQLLERAEEHTEKTAVDAATMLHAKLQPDMFSFSQQLAICAQFSLRACYPAAGREVPEYEGDFTSFDQLRARLTRVIALLDELPTESLTGFEQKTLSEKAGFNQVSLKGEDFIYQYCLPNFFFHLGMAYAILKHHGVQVSKGDYDGFHHYPAGFSFIEDKG